MYLKEVRIIWQQRSDVVSRPLTHLILVELVNRTCLRETRVNSGNVNSINVLRHGRVSRNRDNLQSVLTLM